VNGARVRDRSIVLTWAMRGTLHLVAAEDQGWLVPLVMEPRMANAHRRLNQEGVTADHRARAVRLIERMLERDGPLTRKEIAERLRRHGIRTEGQAIAHLAWLASAEGLVCYGPDRGSTRCFVLVRDWAGRDHAERLEPAAALTELAVRYLKAHGPAEPADLAFWSGIRLGDARRAWRGISDRLVEVRTTQGSRWALRSQDDRAGRGLVRLLPSFDEYLLGWKDRRLVAPAEHWTQINRGGGWLHPVLLVDGRAAGTWSIGETTNARRLEIRPFSALKPVVRRGIQAEAKDLSAFLGTRVEPVLP
jgi:hypothetical protein